MGHKGRFTGIQSGLCYYRVLSASLECVCGYIHVCMCVDACTSGGVGGGCAAARVKADVFCCCVGTLLLDHSLAALCGRMHNGLAGVPASISFHFLLRAPFPEHGFSHFLLLMSALFASLLPRGTTELLKGPFELFVQRMKSSVGMVTGTAHASNWSLLHRWTLTHAFGFCLC